MDEIVARARECGAQDDAVALVELIDSSFQELYFGIPPGELGLMIAAIPPAVLRRSPRAVLAAATFVAQDPDTLLTTPEFVAAIAADPDLRLWRALAAVWRARRAGDVATAYALMNEVPDTIPGPSMPHDPANALRLSVLQERARTAALAGHFQEALTRYERVWQISAPRGFEFFARDAYVRSALIHALSGSRDVARILRLQAKAVPRTSSWAEDELDRESALVDALLAPADQTSSAFDAAVRLTYRPMGELWPFSVDAVALLGVLSGRRTEARERIEALRATGLGTPEGSGFSGSVFGQVLALDALFRGSATEAARELASADPSHWRSQMVACLLGMVVGGGPSQAVRIAEGLAEQTRGLAQAEQRRQALLAIAEFRAGRADEAVHVLDAFADGVPADVSAGIGLLCARLAQQASARISGWPRVEEGPPRGALDAPVLRESELRVLVELARGSRRADIAAALFISENTVKTHQRALYRKLQVANGREAVALSRQYGLI